jgi:hypothetical protein
VIAALIDEILGLPENATVKPPEDPQ